MNPHPHTVHKAALAFVLVALLALLPARLPLQAQGETGPVQLVRGRLEPREHDAFLLRNLQPGDQISIRMQAISGDLDPVVGILDTSRNLAEVEAEYDAQIERLAASGGDMAHNLVQVRDRVFLAWDDDGGQGYTAELEFIAPAAGDYRIIGWASLSALGRDTFGDYELLVGLNAPGATAPAGGPFLERETAAGDLVPAVEEVTGTLTADSPTTTLSLVDIEAGEKLYVSVDSTSGNLIPTVILRDFGGKLLQATNLNGQSDRATLEYDFEELATGHTLEILAARGADGVSTAGDFRALLGLNAPEVLTGQVQALDGEVVKKPIDVQVGVRIERISEVDSQGEDFTVLGSIRMDWTDPALAFSPDECDCAVKVYTEKEFDRFLTEVNSLWPDFIFFNQQGNRWTQSRSAAIWPDGRARYGETFTTTFQTDFDFQQFPFDTQFFPIYVDLILPADNYVLSSLSGYNTINPDHGEDEFIITEFTTHTELVTGRVAEKPVSRFTFSFNAPRHQDYYVLQVFVPILLIILISWFSFFLHDYTRRIEAAAANVLLFIAFSFSLADNYPRLGYITFLDAVMTVTFVFNTLVLVYNVYLKRLETAGRLERIAHIDNVLDWIYPFLYLGMVGIAALWFFA